MNNTVKQEGCNVETYDYRSNFQILTPKEKREVLKNAKRLLKLQKGNNAMLANAPMPENEKN
jgi:predicted Fe-S protein YdhL (DUF1289 family)